MKNALVGVALLVAIMPSDFSVHFNKKDKRDYYEITVYHFKTQEQKQQIDSYLETAYLPALHRMGFSNVGVFTPIANDTVADKRIFIIVPAKSTEAIAELPAKLSKDATYETAAKVYM